MSQRGDASTAASFETPVIARGRLKDRHIAMIALGGAIGAGLFVGSSSAFALAGPGVLLAYVVTGLLVVFVMRLLGELVLARPTRGTFVDCVRDSLGGWPAFLAGWLYWLFWVVVIGAEAIAGAILLQDWVALPVWVLAPGLIVLVNLVNLVSVDLFGECEFWLSGIKVCCILGFVALGILALGHLVGPHPAVRENLLGHGGFLPHGIGAVLATIPTVLFSMVGTEAATVAAAESADARENLARVTRRVGVRVTLFYFISAALILVLVPWTAIRPGHSPFVTAMEALSIPGAALALQIVVFSAVLSCLNSSIYITSRTLAGLAEAGDAPRYFMALNRRGVPQRAVTGCCMIGLLVAFSSILSPGGVFSFILSATGALILLVYALIVMAHFRAKGRNPADPSFTLPLGRGVDGAVVVLIATVLVVMLALPTQRETALASLGSAVVISAVFALRRLVSRRLG